MLWLKRIIAFIYFTLLLIVFWGCYRLGGMLFINNSSDSDINSSVENSVLEYNKSGLFVSSGGQKIFPYSCFAYSLYYDDGNGEKYEDFGTGYYFLESEYYALDELPILVLGGEVTLSMPEDVTVNSINLISADAEDSVPTEISVADITSLKKGEYIVVIRVTLYAKKSNIYHSVVAYDDVFRLILN